MRRGRHLGRNQARAEADSVAGGVARPANRVEVAAVAALPGTFLSDLEIAVAVAKATVEAIQRANELPLEHIGVQVERGDAVAEPAGGQHGH